MTEPSFGWVLERGSQVDPAFAGHLFRDEFPAQSIFDFLGDQPRLRVGAAAGRKPIIILIGPGGVQSAATTDVAISEKTPANTAVIAEKMAHCPFLPNMVYLKGHIKVDLSTKF